MPTHRYEQVPLDHASDDQYTPSPPPSYRASPSSRASRQDSLSDPSRSSSPTPSSSSRGSTAGISLWGTTESTVSSSPSHAQLEAALCNAIERITALETRLAAQTPFRFGDGEERHEAAGRGGENDNGGHGNYSGRFVEYQGRPMLLPEPANSGFGAEAVALGRGDAYLPVKEEVDLESGEQMTRQQKMEKERRDLVGLLFCMMLVMGAVGWWTLQIVRARYGVK